MTTVGYGAKTLNESNFTGNNGGTTQNSFNNGNNLYFDPGSQRLFVVDGGNNRVMIFDVSFANPNFMHMLPD